MTGWRYPTSYPLTPRRLRVRVRERQHVGNVKTAFEAGAVLRQHVIPSERLEHGMDQVLFGVGLVGRAGNGKVGEDATQGRC